MYISLDKNYSEKRKTDFYKSHDVYSKDWMYTRSRFILLDYEGNFAEFLAKNKNKVETILKTEFKKATT